MVTARGGSASHAAVVSRALDKPCVVGCGELIIDLEKRTFRVGDRGYREGAPLSIDGQTGDVYATEIPLTDSARQPATLSRLLDWADEESAASIWMPVRDALDVSALSPRRPAGLAVIAITDILISRGAIGGLIEAIGELSADDGAPTSSVEGRFEQATYDACRALFESARGLPLDLRLPNLSSARARRMVGEWATLAPRLLLPLGPSRLVEALLRAIGSAAADVGHGDVTAIISGITDHSELLAFREMAERAARLRVGALLRNPAAVFSAAERLDDGQVIWVDLHELIRATHGYAEGLLFSDETFEEYVAAGHMARHPRASLDPLVRQLLGSLLAAADKRADIRVGADLGGAPTGAVIGDVYKIGFRRFTSPPEQWECMRLLLAQSSMGDLGHD